MRVDDLAARELRAFRARFASRVGFRAAANLRCSLVRLPLAVGRRSGTISVA
jgi:hypothetical protein